jgi:very-short-patch-repair endonuclease
MSLPEVLLWRELRARPLGLKFRRQHPSGRYVLDFFCSDARLAVEIDGGGHSHSDRAHLDLVRDAWFAEAGIATLRVPARLVLSDLRSAVDLIVSEALKRLPLHHASHGPPPRAKLGED